ncbi:MAG: hypothetical protein COB20_11185 [SAR86 cluster bacterium]|uniref:DUF4381 domain-containing protein n=1 Tax=SAR86 cluster bacterium TaxID=2030880 RepID=A0A2A4X1P9_9GAMM|nr:MAG: hypothetical protein COB20_11185 [SAR86 cluster bacterium]
MDSEELLAQLADIHLPEPVSYWPPAIGWWILAASALVLLVILFRKFANSQRQQKICQYALAELQRCYDSYSQADPANIDQSKLDYVNQFNTVVRRVALVHYPQANAASLDGASWVDFIRQKGESSLMTDDIAAALQYGRFQSKCDVDVDAMQRFGQQWVESLYKGSANSPEKPSEDSKDNAASDPQGLSSDA